MVLKTIWSLVVETNVTVAFASGLPLYVTLPLTSVLGSGGFGGAPAPPGGGGGGGEPLSGGLGAVEGFSGKPGAAPPGAVPSGRAGVVPGGVVPGGGGAGAAPGPPLSTSRTRSMVT